MKTAYRFTLVAALLAPGLFSCSSNQSGTTATTDSTVKSPEIRTEAAAYQSDTLAMEGFAAYDANGKSLPIVLVVPEWWGLNEYAKSRARQLADLGYMAFAVDMYGHGVVAAEPKEAGKYAMPFYENPQLGKRRLEAALAKAKTYSQADTTRLAAIGYCFGGAMVLNGAKLGMPFDGVVSFHGNLEGVPAVKDLLRARVLVCHGAEDKAVPPETVVRFRKEMDSIGARYIFKEYANATHAFTNPASTETGKKFNLPIAYNAAADSASWSEMKSFLSSVFSE